MLAKPLANSGNWRDRFQFAWQLPDPEPDEGPGLTWRQLTPRHWSGSWNGKLHGTITAEGDRWLAYVRLEDPPGLSPSPPSAASTPSRPRSWRPTRVGVPVTAGTPTMPPADSIRGGGSWTGVSCSALKLRPVSTRNGGPGWRDFYVDGSGRC
jgi:hypothetical protein